MVRCTVQPERALVGRRAELGRLVQELRLPGRHVVIAGDEGVGKTRLAAEVAATLESRGRPVNWVFGQAAIAEVPLGCFAAILAGNGDEGLLDVARAITRRCGGNAAVLVVDDAHLLDDLSAVAVQQIAASGAATVIATLRAGERPPVPIAALWQDEMAVRIDLAPLAEAAVGALVEVLGGLPVDDATRRFIADRCRGNLTLLSEIVLVARASGGQLTVDHLRDALGSAGQLSRLLEVLESRLHGLTREQRHAVELVAVAEEVPELILAALCPDVDMELLTRRRLVRYEQSCAGPVVVPGYPVLADVMRASLPPPRLRALAARLVESLDRVGLRGEEDLLRRTCWRLTSGQGVDAGSLIDAGNHAFAHHALALAERLARAAVDAGGGFAARLLLARMLGAIGRVADAEVVFAQLDRRDVDVGSWIDAVIARLDNLCYGLGRPRDALVVAEREEVSLEPGPGRDDIKAYRASLLDVTGQTAAALSVALDVLPTAQGRAWIWASTMAAWGYVRTGQFSEAIEVADAVVRKHRVLSGAGLAWNHSIHTTIKTFALAFAGRLAEAERCAQAEYRSGRDDNCAETQWLTAMALGSVHLLQGRLLHAADRGREAARLGREHGRLIVSLGGLVCQAEALAQLGRADEAASVLQQLDPGRGDGVGVLGPDLLRARAWLAVARDQMAPAADLFTEAAQVAREAGDRVGELHAWSDLARIGIHPEGRLDELGAEVEGPLARLRIEHAGACHRQSATELESVAAAFEQLGALLLAAESWADASVVHLRVGDHRRALKARRLATALTARCDGARTPSLAVAGAARAALSRREMEIAKMAADGSANRQIAESLRLSPRTIENRLRMAYEKLGITGRDELAAALGRTRPK